MRSLLPAWMRWNSIVVLVSMALTVSGQQLAGTGVDPELLTLVACGTLFVYGADRRSVFAPEDHNLRSPTPPVPKPVLAMAFAALAVCTLHLNGVGRGVVIGLGLLSALYILPVLPGHQRLKEVPYSKAILVAMGWAVATMLLPSVHAHATGDWRVGCLVLYRALFLLPNALLADWPDRESDRTAGIRTFANQLPPPAFTRLCQISCLLTIGLGALLCLARILPPWAAWEFAVPVGFLTILRRPLPGSRRFYATVADAIVGWPGIVALISIV